MSALLLGEALRYDTLTVSASNIWDLFRREGWEHMPTSSLNRFLNFMTQIYRCHKTLKAGMRISVGKYLCGMLHKCQHSYEGGLITVYILDFLVKRCYPQHGKQEYVLWWLQLVISRYKHIENTILN